MDESARERYVRRSEISLKSGAVLNKMSQQSNRESEVMIGIDSGHPFGERPKRMSFHGTFRRRGREFKRSTVAIGLGALVFTVCSMGDTFEIIEGKGVGVCQAYLSAVQKWEPGDMACLGDRPLDAEGIARISAPIWEIEDSTVENGPGYKLSRSAGEFVGRYDRNLAAYYYRDKLSEWRATPEQIAVAQQGVLNHNHKYSDGVLRILQVDVNNDGKQDDVLFFAHCYTGSTATSLAMSSPLILTESRAEVDEERTLKLLREPIRYRLNPNPRRLADNSWAVDADVYSGAAYGFLRFDGKTYFDFWWDVAPNRVPDPKDANVLRVYFPNGSSTRPVCSIRVNSGAQR
jgi:hypothetical protein